MRKSFYEFLADKVNEGINAEVKLSADSDFKPFDMEHHINLKVLTQAFLDSPKVFLPGPDGYPQKLTTIDPSSGESSPKLKKKQLYLVGGAVRDHLLGKTPKNYDLATDATPDEMRLILRSAGFTEVKPKETKHAKYEKLQDAGSKTKVFFAKGWDRAGKEFSMNARVNGEDFTISTFSKESKDGKTPDKTEFTSSLEDDTAKRDFTINAMAIPLTNTDGPNNKLIDPHGGAHHLKSGEVRFVGDAKERLQEDQLRALRYIRFASRFDNKMTIPPEYKEAIKEIKDLPKVSRENIRDEFVKGLEHPDVDVKKYIKLYKDFELLPTVFPGMTFKLDDEKKDFTDKKDKRLAVAWLLRTNNPEDIKEMLAHGSWGNNEINDIIHLIKMNKWASKYGKDDDGFYNDFYDMKANLHQKTSLVPSIVKQWGKMNNHDEDMVSNFLSHELGTKSYVKDGFGGRSVNPELIGIFGQTPQGSQFSDGIKKLETDKFKDKLRKI